METTDGSEKWVLAGIAVAIILLIVSVVFGVEWAQSHLLAQVDQYASG